MHHHYLRPLAGAALAALVISTTVPRFVGAQPTPAPRVTPAPHSSAVPSIAPNANIMLPPASQPTSLPYPAYGTPVPGVDSGVVNPNVPQVITLPQAIAIGYAQSPLLAQARAQLAIASAPVALAKTAILPNIAGSASTSRDHAQDGSRNATTITDPVTGVSTTTVSSGPATTTSNGLSVTLRQLIFDGGRVAAQLRSAQNNQSAQADQYRRTLQTVAFNIANAYYNELAAQRATAIAVQTVSVNQVNENLVSAQIRAGAEARADLSTAQLPTAQARLAVVRAQGTELSSQAAFANSMGLDANTLVLPKDDTPVNGAPITAFIPIPTYQIAITRALALRPDVSSAQYSVDSNRASVRAARLGLFPNLNGDASAQTASTDPTGGTFRNNSSIGLTLSIPIFDQGITKAQTAQAQGNLDLAIANQTTTIQGVQLNVKQTLVALVSARAALDQANAELSKAQDVFNSTEAQYKAGVTTLPLLLNAQVGITQALTDESTAVYTLRQAEQAFLFAEGANGLS
jgi:outer membrane protein